MGNDIDTILAAFPKTPTILPQRYQDIYKQEYKRGRTPDGLFLRLVHYVESWMHRTVSKKEAKKILEIGAGTLNHVPYEKNWEGYDIIEPMPYLFQGSKSETLISNHYSRISELPSTKCYDKIISIAVFEHMVNLPLEIALLSKNSNSETVFSIAIPNEGGFLWWLSWRCTTGLSFWLRHGLDYGVMMKHEHINTATEIIAVCKYFFKKVKIKRFPLIDIIQVCSRLLKLKILMLQNVLR
jgi:hypothetical protein